MKHKKDRPLSYAYGQVPEQIYLENQLRIYSEQLKNITESMKKYEGVWKDNKRRWSDRTNTWDILHKYGHDYKVVFVGDAAMSPYEVTHPGGSVEHFNEESGSAWLQRVAHVYPATVWINPVPEKQWSYSQSTKMIRELIGGSMHPLTLSGLDDAMRELTRKKH